LRHTFDGKGNVNVTLRDLYGSFNKQAQSSTQEEDLYMSHIRKNSYIVF